VREVGDLSGAVAIDTIDASQAFLHPRPEALATSGTNVYLTIGARAAIDIRATADPRSRLRQTIQ
jgi:hypothetical protein